jgi:hypothetical protein
MTFSFGNLAQSITAISIEFLNYPAQGFSLPNLELYSTTTSAIVDSSNPQLAQRIEFDLQNSVLSPDDYQVTNVSLILSEELPNNNILLRWNYTGVYNLNYFIVSEVDFCSNTQPPGETQITFQHPQSDNSVIMPTTDELTINCTVSSSGLFEWQWTQNGSVISINDKFSLFTADGTRTGILQITGLNASDAATYTCVVRRRSGGGSVTRTQILSFSGMLTPVHS